MAEVDSGEYEVKDEELVDFEGSDYGFGSDEELEIEDEVMPGLGPQDEEQTLDRVEGGEEGHQAAPKVVEGAQDAAATVSEVEKKDGAESGEIEDEREEKEDGVVLQPVAKKRESNHGEGRGRESRRKHRKADLEDGELDDAAMPEGSDHEAERNADDDDEDVNERRERKRRKDRFAAERLSEDAERKERESIAGAPPARQHRSRGSERPVERLPGFAKAGNAGDRGMIQIGGFGHSSNTAPGIMGPGRPLVPLDLAATLPLHPVGRGFMGPLAGMQMARANFQEVMAVRQHILHSQMMQQLVHTNAAGRGRHPMAGPVGPGMRPMLGLEFGGPLAQGMMHLQAQSPELTAQMNFVGSLETYSRNSQAAYGGRAAGSMFGQVAAHMGSPRSGMGRQMSWPVVPMQSAEVPTPGRGRGQGRGQVASPVWADPHGVGMVPATAGGAGHNGSIVRGQNAIGAGSGKLRQGSGVRTNQAQRDQSSAKRTQAAGRMEPDGTWRIDGERSTRNGVAQTSGKDTKDTSSNTGGPGIKRERDNGRDKAALSSTPSNLHKSSSGTQGNGTNNGAGSSSNLIQLGGPVQKSRVLTVSGLPENTSMSVVVEAFEKQGKVTDLLPRLVLVGSETSSTKPKSAQASLPVLQDFRKEERGDAFTITFASVSEAISAQRHLHRSILAGQQITVEYAVQQPVL